MTADDLENVMAGLGEEEASASIQQRLHADPVLAEQVQQEFNELERARQTRS